MNITTNDVFLSRQFILDKKQEIVGYELTLQYLTSPDGSGEFNAADVALLICSVYAELGIKNALGKNKAYLQIDHTFLDDEIIELLPTDSVVLELIIDETPDEFLIERCKILKDKRFSLAMVDYDGLNDRSQSLINLLSIVKINIQNHDKEALQSLTGSICRLPIKMMAEGVNYKNDFEQCLDLGFQLFQGRYFSEPEIVSGRQLTASQINLINLINLMNQDVATSVLEEKIKREPALSVNLLCIVNSVDKGMTRRVSSLKSAITLLGRRKLQRWLQLLLLTPAGQTPDITRSPILQVAALRGRMIESLAKYCYPHNQHLSDHGFIVGIMSMMSLALGMTNEQIFEQIALDEEVEEAVVNKKGNLGRLLEIVDTFDREQFELCDSHLAKTPNECIDRGLLNACLIDAVRWINGGDE